MTEVREVIPVHKHYLVIDSPIPFTLEANDGTDIVYRMAGAWRIDLWKLLTKEYFKQYPVFKLTLVYDSDLLESGKSIIIRESDIDLGTGISGVNGQEVLITNFDEMPTPILPENYKVTNELDSNNNKVPLEVTDSNTLAILNYLPELKKKVLLVDSSINFPLFLRENIEEQQVKIGQYTFNNVYVVDVLYSIANGTYFNIVSLGTSNQIINNMIIPIQSNYIKAYLIGFIVDSDDTLNIIYIDSSGNCFKKKINGISDKFLIQY